MELIRPRDEEDKPRRPYFMPPAISKQIDEGYDAARAEEAANDAFFYDQQSILDRAEARQYKSKAKSAMDAAFHKNTAEFGPTFDRWLKRNKVVRSIQEGEFEPSEPKYQLDTRKVGFSVALQGASLGLAGLVAAAGFWPAALITVPSFLVYNYYWLEKHQRGA